MVAKEASPGGARPKIPGGAKGMNASDPLQASVVIKEQEIEKVEDFAEVQTGMTNRPGDRTKVELGTWLS